MSTPNERQSDGTAAPEPENASELNGGCHPRLVRCSSFLLEASRPRESGVQVLKDAMESVFFGFDVGAKKLVYALKKLILLVGLVIQRRFQCSPSVCGSFLILVSQIGECSEQRVADGGSTLEKVIVQERLRAGIKPLEDLGLCCEYHLATVEIPRDPYAHQSTDRRGHEPPDAIQKVGDEGHCAASAHWIDGFVAAAGMLAGLLILIRVTGFRL